MLNIRSITIAVISILCLVTAVWAGEKKEESKIELKLVYEKRFDFEIAQGKISENGIFPTIFVTKDDRVLFFDKDAEIRKTLKLTKGQIPFLSEDNKYIGIVNYPENWWEEGVGTPIELYDCTGKMLWKIKPPGECYRNMSILKGRKGIVISSSCEKEGLARADFYNKEGELIKSYIHPSPFPVDTLPLTDKLHSLKERIRNPRWLGIPIPESGLRALGRTFGTENGYFYCMAEGGVKSWIAILNPRGELMTLKEFYGEHFSDTPIISRDLRRLIYASMKPLCFFVEHQEPVEIREITLKIYDFSNNTKKETGIIIAPVTYGSFYALFNFSEDSKYFWVMNENKFHFGDAQKGNVIYSWEAPNNELIRYACISSEGHYALCSLMNGKMFILNCDGEVVYEGKTKSEILDVRIDEEKRMIEVLTKTGLYKNIW